MKKNVLLGISILTLLFTSCGSSKSAISEALFNTTWELDYISGKRIAFEALFPQKKPQISFDQSTNKITGNAGCNGYSTAYNLNGNSISFGEPGPSTMMYCGEGEKDFLNLMQKVDAYNFDAEGKLNLLVGDVPMLRFKKID